MKFVVWSATLLGMLSWFAPGMPESASSTEEAPTNRTSQSRASTAEESTPAKPFRLVSAKRDAYYRELLPELANKELQELLAHPDTIFYTENEIPPAYQLWDGQLPGVHSPSYNISANGSEPFGNGNLEFPWKTTAGIHRSPGVDSIKMLALPRDDEGKRLPVVWYPHRYRGDTQRGYAWVFPAGTVVAELLTMKAPNGQRVAFELRMRRRTLQDWEVDVFRPFPTAKEFAEAIRSRRPNWQADPNLSKVVEHLEAGDRLAKQRLQDQHPNQTFNQVMGVDQLPSLQDNELVLQLLQETPFKSCHGLHWAETETLYTNAPTTRADFHIVPKEYLAGFIDVDESSCMRCHDTVGKNVNNFEFGRDWYGRIRGADGIFSFHPFSRGSISYNGYGNSVSMRSDFVEAGIVEKFNPKKHPKSRYRQLSFLGE